LTSDAQRIARGQEPAPFDRTFTHPVHGELRFRCSRLPKAAELLAHSIEMDNQLHELAPGADPRQATMILAAAIAGLKPRLGEPGRGVLMEQLPVIGESRREDPESGKTTIETHYYDAEAETDIAFLTEVWIAYSEWRMGILAEVDAVKGPSGETRGLDSSESSTAPTVSPSTIPA
jgi:hypothetical protein